MSRRPQIQGTRAETPERQQESRPRSSEMPVVRTRLRPPRKAVRRAGAHDYAALGDRAASKVE